MLGIELEPEAKEGEGLPRELVGLAAEYAGYGGDDPAEAAEMLLDARQAARSQKNWGVADAIRDGIAELGLMVEDTPAGARLRAKKD